MWGSRAHSPSYSVGEGNPGPSLASWKLGSGEVPGPYCGCALHTRLAHITGRTVSKVQLQMSSFPETKMQVFEVILKEIVLFIITFFFLCFVFSWRNGVVLLAGTFETSWHIHEKTLRISKRCETRVFLVGLVEPRKCGWCSSCFLDLFVLFCFILKCIPFGAPKSQEFPLYLMESAFF